MFDKHFLHAQASRLLDMHRSSTFYINNKEAGLNFDAMIMQLYAYVESALPVVIGVDLADLKWGQTKKSRYHSLIVIGHTMKDNKVDGFLVRDESEPPYHVMTESELRLAWHKPKRQKKESIQQRNLVQEDSGEDRIRELLVAVPTEVSLPFHEAYHGFHKMLNSLHNQKIIDEDIDNLQFRPMLTKPTFLYSENEFNFPSFIWLMHFKTKDTDWNNSKGFLARDATGRTNLTFAYVKDNATAIYQTEDEKTFQGCNNKAD